MQTITVGPFPFFFSNKNKEMNLPGHSHAAEARLTFLTMEREDCGGRGFPSFQDTYDDALARIWSVVEKPIEGTNELLARMLFAAFERWTTPAIQKYGGEWVFKGVDLDVISQRDKIGHSAGFTRYGVHLDEGQAKLAFAGWKGTR